MSENKDDSKKEVDPELDDLLDSALQDMTKKDSQSDTTSAEVPQNLWSEEFIKEAAAQFESNMASILGNFSEVPVNHTTVGSGQCTNTVPMATSPNPKENKSVPAPGSSTKIVRRQCTNTVPMATTPKPKENKSVPAPGSSTKIVRRHSDHVLSLHILEYQSRRK